MTRDLTAGVLTQVNAEKAIIRHFFQLDFATIKDITAFANGGTGLTRVTCSGHGRIAGDTITIYGTSNFDGTYVIQTPVTSTYFTISKSYLAGDGSGYLEIPDPIYLTNMSHDVPWNSITWLGVGGNLTFSNVTETADLNSYGIDGILSGVDQSITALILQKKYIGRNCTIWRVDINASGAIVSDPTIIFFGLMNGGFKITQIKRKGKPTTVTVTMRLTSGLGEFTTIKGTQMNTASHQKWSPGDEFFRNVPGLRRKTVNLKQNQ